jgi:hypothetical protein
MVAAEQPPGRDVAVWALVVVACVAIVLNRATVALSDATACGR